MKKVFIKYNPYKLETEIKVDGKKLAQNSILGEKSSNDSRLQEWVEELPHILIDEYNDTEFDVTFHGTLLDYEDLAAVFSDARERGEITEYNFDRQPAKETTDKEVLIDEVFNEIKCGPFDEFRDKEIISAFELAKSDDFELCVVATMSAGKSTLINAMLGTKLMPSKQEACTAIITRIKDVSDNPDAPFEAEVYDKDDVLSESQKKLTYQIMERLNSNENVSEIRVYGNIPFVTSEDVSLVLIDTPGPNNSRDPRHRRVQSELLGKSSKALILYIMTGEFGTDDDNTLLKRVSESMAVGGKQSKDRFIFVVNKLDDRKKEDGDTEQTLDKVRSYLKTHGVANPNLFPAGALPALWIRQYQSGELTVENDEDEVLDMETKIKKFNRNSNGSMHFENYASLPPSIRGEINSWLEANRARWKGNDNGNPDEALIHTGVVSIEAAIRQYVQKYAKTAKIKNIVDTFMHKLREVGYLEKTKHELAANQEESKRIVAQIAAIREKLDDGNNAKKFKDAVGNAVNKARNDSRDAVEEIIQKLQSRISDQIKAFGGTANLKPNQSNKTESSALPITAFFKHVADISADSRQKLNDSDLNVGAAYDVVKRMARFAEELDPEFAVEIDNIVKKSLVETSISLLKQYKAKLASLTKDVTISEINIDPLRLMAGSVTNNEFDLVSKYTTTKKVATGKHQEWYEIEVPRKPILGLGIRDAIFGKKKETRSRDITDYEEKQVEDCAILVQEFFRPIQQVVYENGDAAIKYALEQSKKIEEHFNAEFKRLDDILKSKLAELESYATDQKKADERIKESERKLAWLEQIIAKVESILEI